MKGNKLDIVAQIHREGTAALKPLYTEIKPGFMQYMLRYTTDNGFRQDAFQEAVIAFYEYCLSGKYDPSRSSPKSMVYRMGKAYLLNRLRKENKSLRKEDEVIDHLAISLMDKYQHLNLNEYELKVRGALLNLGEKCRKLLILSFYHEYSIDAIREHMQYKNDNTVSSHKSRCLKQLKQAIIQSTQ